MKVKKILKRIGWGLLGLYIVMWSIGFFAPEFTSTLPERMESWVQNRIEAKRQAVIDEQVNALREKYKNDFDGGKTPEETLDLFITALKAGDIEKASKYYELSVQGKALEGLEKELQKQGDLHQSIEYVNDVYKRGVKKCNEKGDGCTFDYTYTTIKDETVSFGKNGDKLFVPAGSKSSKFTDMEKNPYTKIWKIKQPY